MLVDGVRQGRFHPVQGKDGNGDFVRQESVFRGWLGRERFPVEAGRYRLYVALTCPWASRVLGARRLKGLEAILPVSVVAPWPSGQGWPFAASPGARGEDPVHAAHDLHELYSRADPHFTGRATVPLRWDTRADTPVNDESADLLRMVGSVCDELLPPERAAIDRYPADLRDDIDALDDWLHQRVNNDVYRGGFATTQVAYEEAVDTLFSALDALDALDALEARLSDAGPYVFGDRLTETDIRLFVTLIRSDIAYHGAFKTTLPSGRRPRAVGLRAPPVRPSGHRPECGFPPHQDGVRLDRGDQPDPDRAAGPGPDPGRCRGARLTRRNGPGVLRVGCATAMPGRNDRAPARSAWRARIRRPTDPEPGRGGAAR